MFKVPGRIKLQSGSGSVQNLTVLTVPLLPMVETGEWRGKAGQNNGTACGQWTQSEPRQGGHKAQMSLHKVKKKNSSGSFLCRFSVKVKAFLF